MEKAITLLFILLGAVANFGFFGKVIMLCMESGYNPAIPALTMAGITVLFIVAVYTELAN
jgi:hypothetical protein